MSTSIARKPKYTPYPTYNTLCPTQLRELDSIPGRVRKPAPSCNCLQQPFYYKRIVASFYFSNNNQVIKFQTPRTSKVPMLVSW